MANVLTPTFCPSCGAEVSADANVLSVAVVKAIQTRPDLSYADIASMFDVSKITVIRYAKQAGIQRGPSGPKKRPTVRNVKPPLPPGIVDMAGAVAYTIRSRPNLSYREIGEMFHVCMRTVKRYAKLARIIRGCRGPKKRPSVLEPVYFHPTCPHCGVDLPPKKINMQGSIVSVITTRPELEYKEIAAQFHVSKSTVTRYAQRAGLKRGRGGNHRKRTT